MPLDPTGLVSHQDRQHRGMSWKVACRCATTANITIATALNAGDVIDGVTLAAGDRVLVKDQADATENGVYVAGATPARAWDMDQDATTDVPASEVLGAFIPIVAGTMNEGTVWRATNTAVPVLGTTPIFFAQFAAIVGPGVLYFDDDTTVAPYQALVFVADTVTAEELDTAVCNSGSGEVLIEGYMTAAGVPGLTIIPSGQWAFHTFRKVDATTGVTQLVFRVFRYALDTTETELFSVTSDEINDTVVNSVAAIYSTSQPEFVVAATDRLLVKVYAQTTSVPNRTVTLYHNGTQHYSHLVTPFASPGTGGVTDHGALSGLTDDDHPDYVTVYGGGEETVQTHGASGATETIDLANGNVHAVTLSADCTFTFTAPTNAVGVSFLLELTEDGTGGWDPTWPGSVVWPGGSAPTHDTTAGSVTLYLFYTRDAGTTWYGFQAGGGGVPATTVTDETTWGITPAVGTDIEYARQDHTHGSPAQPGIGPILIADDHGTPLIFDDLLQTEAGDDLLYAEP